MPQSMGRQLFHANGLTEALEPSIGLDVAQRLLTPTQDQVFGCVRDCRQIAAQCRGGGCGQEDDPVALTFALPYADSSGGQAQILDLQIVSNDP